MDEKFTKPYNPAATEGSIYKKWEESGYFNPDNLPDQNGPTYTIVMPPPNANGDLHAGHALFITLEDIMIRYARMCGKRALWIPGADHAGFETQIVYEKKLEKEGRSRFKMSPEELYKEIYDFTLVNKAKMENQVRSLGASCDWSRERFTLDEDVVKTVQQIFKKMYEDKLVYRGKRIINWCTKHQTSLSDVETEFLEKTEAFYYFKYGPFTISTARPETKFGDKYVVMHPADARYQEYKDGQKIELEWINGPITATIIKDEAIDMEFGTGVMTITPWHDVTDFGIADRHNLDKEQIIDERGKLLPIAGEFAGMKIAEARPKIVEKLKDKGLLVKVDEKYVHNVKVCYKCQTTIEPQIRDQWFVKMAPLAKRALEAVEAGKVIFYPDNYRKIFNYWMENTLDWNISRQIVWGIPIPAWFKGEEIYVGENPPGNGWTKDTDTFDTWFSSGQWPLIVTGYPNADDFKKFYPTQVMETGHDLIFKWVPRMVIFGLYLADQVPFRDVYLHGLVNDAKGAKMSKSKGNVVNPLELTAKYGTDALRMSLIIGNPPGSESALAEPKIKGYKNFANKVWNIARFILSSAEGQEFDEKLITEDTDKKLIEEFNILTKDITSDLDNYRFHLGGEKIYHYLWHELADKIIEESKPIIADSNAKAKLSRQHTLLAILKKGLIILHPFMPFITEEIWTNLVKPKNDKDMLIVAKWTK